MSVIPGEFAQSAHGPPSELEAHNLHGDETHSTAEVTKMTGVSFRMLNYYAHTGRIPGQPKNPGSGVHRRWTPEQIELVRTHVASRAMRRPLSIIRKHGLAIEGNRRDIKARSRALNRLAALYPHLFENLYVEELQREVDSA